MEDFNGTFEEIDPRLIHVDHRYQRPEKESLIATISLDFKWSSFGALICYRRGNQVYAVDGQQRLRSALAQDKPPKTVPCIVFPQSTLEKESQSFLDIQINRKAVTAYEKHEAELVAKNPSALAIQKAVDMVGYTIGVGGGADGQGEHRTIHAVRALHYVYDLLGEDGVVQVLTQAREAWPGDPKGHSVHMLKGLANLILEMGDKYNRSKVTAALKNTSPADINRKARAFQIDAGGSMRQNVDRAIKNLVKV